MAEDIVAISSAIVLPEPEVRLEDTGVLRTTKRRQSPSPEPTSKRPRLSAESTLGSPPTIRASPNASPQTAEPANPRPNDVSTERRQSNAQEERKRGRRLFGSLLNTLSQSTSDAHQKKRSEIEKRLQEKARMQKAEDESRRAERLHKLKEIRMGEQMKFDEQSMRIRHSNMLAMAQFLCTKSEPKLYYKPWELLPGDAERIKQQIADTEALMDQEIREFKLRHNIELQVEERPGEKTDGSAEEAEGEHDRESLPVPLVAESDSTNHLSHIKAADPEHAHVSIEKDPLEDNGEVIVEGDEDTVIY